MSRKMSEREFREKLAAAKAGDLEAAAAILAEYEGAVKSTAYRVAWGAGRPEWAPDCESEAREHFVFKVLPAYDPDKGELWPYARTAITRHLWRWIRGATRDERIDEPDALATEEPPTPTSEAGEETTWLLRVVRRAIRDPVLRAKWLAIGAIRRGLVPPPPLEWTEVAHLLVFPDGPLGAVASHRWPDVRREHGLHRLDGNEDAVPPDWEGIVDLVLRGRSDSGLILPAPPPDTRPESLSQYTKRLEKTYTRYRQRVEGAMGDDPEADAFWPV